MVLEAQPDLVVVAEAATGAEALAAAAREPVDLAVLDVAMPRMTGLQAAAELTRRRPEVRLLILSMYDSEQYLYEALQRGGVRLRLEVGGRPRPRGGVPCRHARRAVSLPGAVTALIADYLQRARAGGEVPADPLTPRELEVVKLIAEA